MPFWVYIIESKVSAMTYIGQTNNLTDRLKRHNENRNSFTKGKGPWSLIYSEQFTSRVEAVRKEKYFKSLKNKEYLLKIIQRHVG